MDMLLFIEETYYTLKPTTVDLFPKIQWADRRAPHHLHLIHLPLFPSASNLYAKLS